MITRSIYPRDLEQIKLIHDKYYKYEFDFEVFASKFLGSFAILEDDDKTIISAGGVRTIAEAVIVTNKDISVAKRRRALFDILQVSSYICTQSGHDQLHAFIEDESWLKHLLKNGFVETKGKSLVLEV